MLNDEQDKDAMRRQSTALVIFALLAWAWITWYGPKFSPPPAQKAPAPGATTSADAGSPGASESPEAVAANDAPAWPYLPPVPESVDPSTDEIAIGDDDLQLTFTRIGARLKRATVLLGNNGAGDVQLVPSPGKDVPDTQAIYPLGLRFTEPLLADHVDLRRFEAAPDSDGRGVTFSLELPGAALIKKSFRLGDKPHIVDVSVSYENREATARALGLDLTPAYILNWGPSVVDDHSTNGPPTKFVWSANKSTSMLEARKLPGAEGPAGDQRVPGADWIGYKTLYFLAALRPAGDSRVDGWITGAPNNFRFGLYQPRFELAPGQSNAAQFQLYLGPMHLGELNKAWPTLSTALRFYGPGGWFGDTVSDLMDWFSKQLLSNLNWWHGFVPNYGVAIILLTVLVRMVVFPLTIRSMRSMKKMQALQPEMLALKEKYEADPQEYQRQMMLLYRERKINPLAGCLPLFLQMPVFFALYRMLWYAFELRGAQFLWIKDLSQPDRLFHFPALAHLPLIGDLFEYFNLLPFLVCAAMMISFRLTPQTGPGLNPQQKFMMNFMPIIFTFFGYKFAAGLNLYVFTSTVLGMLQNYVVRVTEIGGPPVPTASAPAPGAAADSPKKKPEAKPAAPFMRRKKPQHFYDRAQQRKREMAKAEKKRPKK